MPQNGQGKIFTIIHKEDYHLREDKWCLMSFSDKAMNDEYIIDILVKKNLTVI